MAEKSGPRTTKGAKAPRKSTSRREGVRRTLGRRTTPVRDMLSSPIPATALLIALIFVLVASAIVSYTRGKLLIAPGRIMDETRAVRVPFEIIDQVKTDAEREARRQRAPQVFAAVESHLDQLEASLMTLPAALAAADSLDKVAQEVRDAFKLTEEQLKVIRNQTTGSEVTTAWESQVQRLMSLLQRNPILTNEQFQLALQDRAELQLEMPDGAVQTASFRQAINVEQEDLTDLINIANNAGFFGTTARVVAQRLTAEKLPTFTYDRESTEAVRAAAAESVPPRKIRYARDQIIFSRGDNLTQEQYALALREQATFLESMPITERLLRGGAIVGVMLLVAFALGGYMALFYPRAVRNPLRVGAMTTLLLGALILACWGAIQNPNLFWLATLAPVMFCAMILVIAYDRRLALAATAFLTILLGFALDLSLAHFACSMLGVGVAVWRLDEIRNRTDVVQAALFTGASLALGVIVLSFLQRPLSTGIVREVLNDALLAGAGGFLAGAITLFVLPSVERIFGITTGMTLSEWRDPKQPLLRLLQQRAPGTFNHSHTVATLAEAAAEAIGADGLHVYVGALYHDVGKMNKPDYFVENQSGGPSRHSKLSPAMSLLVIVGHVKDGIELAREYGLPRSLHHYIESHHGTTLVEYFFDQARRQAEADQDAEQPREIEYRYPGPKPRTKEAAILMLCDAVESATRAMSDPTPSRIGQLVHQIASARLMDGQFDQSNLTLRELTLIEEEITKVLCSIYHGRIAYPSTDDRAKADTPTQPGRRESVETRSA